MQINNTTELAKILKEQMLAFDVLEYDPSGESRSIKELREEVIDKMIHWVIYQGKLSSMVRNFIKIEELTCRITSQNDIRLYFHGTDVESGVILAVRFSYIETSTNNIQEYQISYLHLNNIIYKYAPKELYKNYYKAKNVPINIVETDDIQVSYEIYSQMNGQGCLYFYGNSLLTEFKPNIIDFINNSQQLIIQFQDKNHSKIRRKSYVLPTLKGVRFYKVPVVNYDNELEQISKIVSKYGDMGDLYCTDLWSLDGIYKYLTQGISFEISESDSYLEVYGTVDNYTRLLNNEIFTTCSWIKLYPIDHMCESIKYLAPVKVGHQDNRLCTFVESLTFEDEEREYE